MCSCFKNLICCVVSQLADFSNQLRCYKAATMSYKNNFDAAVVKSISIDRFCPRRKLRRRLDQLLEGRVALG